MQYSGLYRCSGCSVTFSDPVAWREGPDKTVVVREPGPPAHVVARTTLEPDAPVLRPCEGHISLHDVPGTDAGFGNSETDLREIRAAAERANRSKGRRR